MDKAAFLATNLLAIAIAISISRLLLGGRERWRQILGAAAGFPLIIYFVLIILGHFGQLGPTAVTAFLTILFCIVFLLRVWLPGPQSMQAPSPNKPDKENNSVLFNISLGLLALFASLIFTKTVVLGTRFLADDQIYHAAAVAEWVVRNHFDLAPFNYHAYYPYNAEMLSLWFVLPFHSDAYASLSGFLWSILSVVSLISICRVLGCTTPTSLLCATLFIAPQFFIKSVYSYSAVDLAGTALMLTAIALSMLSRPVETNVGGNRVIDSVYSGLLAGMAVGCKISVAPVAAVLALWFGFGAKDTFTARTRARSSIVFIVCALLTGSYWYIRNLIITGNPLFPAEFGVFDGPFTAVSQYHTKLVYWIFNEPFKALGNEFFRYASSNAGVISICVIGYASALISTFRRGISGRDRDRHMKLLLIIGLTLLCLYPFMPFSGRVNTQDAPFQIDFRYILIPIAIGSILYARFSDDHPRLRPLLIGLFIVAIAATWRTSRLTILSLLLATMVLAYHRWLSKYLRNPKEGAFYLLMAVFLVALSLWAPHKQRLTNKSLNDPWINRWGVDWEILESMPPGATVATFGRPTWFSYPIYGRKLQYRYIPIRSDGTPYVHLHHTWKQDQLEWWETDKHTNPNMDHLIYNLTEADIEYVVIVRNDKGSWPTQQDVLSKSDLANLYASDQHMSIWKIE